MKKLFGTLVCLVMWSVCFAGPFGLSIGMTLEEVTEACGGKSPRLIDDGQYLIEPEKRHSMFEHYVVWIDDAQGLHCIRAWTRDISTSGYGTEIQSAFSTLETSLSKSYEKPTKRIDEVDPASYWIDEKYWMRALSQGARTLAAGWEDNLSDGLSGVYLWVHAESESKGVIILEYNFENHELVESAEDEVL